MNIQHFQESLCNTLNIETALVLRENDEMQRLKEWLSAVIEEMIDRDFEGLMWKLYRIDVSEQKLKERLANAPLDQSAAIIADMIIERELEKMKTRDSFKGDWEF